MFAQFRQMAAEAGRAAESVPITVYGVGENIDLLKRYRDAGTARVMFELPSAGEEEILPMLDRCAELIRQI